MFTGIIEAVGRIAALERHGVDARVHIDTGKLDMHDVRLGDSIAVSGVCLTVIGQGARDFSADVSGETLARTRLGELSVGAGVNLERALTPTTRLGGHLVSGHVDGVGELVARHEEGRSLRLRFRAPADLSRYIAAKGSICVDGVSLTVNAVQDREFADRIEAITAASLLHGPRLHPGVEARRAGQGCPGCEFDVNVVPHTLAETTLGELRAGNPVNLEVDVLARYLERLLLGERAAEPSSRISEAFLGEHGFLGGER
jgi:riboflavin synthase